MKHLRDIALASAAIICGSNSDANAEKWSCEMEILKGKTYKQEWIVLDDKMFSPKGKGYFRVELNNSDTLFAFTRFSNVYVVISKRTGVVTEIHEIPGLDYYGKEPEQWVPPGVSVGHCSLEQP